MDTKKLQTKEIGNSGVSITSGLITGEEYNPKLTGKSAIDAYDQMRRSDATVNAALNAVKLPILSADFTIDPASDDDVDKEVAEFIQDCLFHIVDWDQFLGEALTFLDFGYDVHEMVFEPREVNGTLRIALVKLGYRKQTTIQKWETTDGKPGIQQFDNTGHTYSIPAEKLVRFTHKQEGDNYEGISLLRAAYKHWYIKDKLYRIDAVGHERHALGVIDVTVPTGALEEDKKKMRQLVRNLRANEESYIEHPEGWIVAFLDMKANSLKDVEPSINHHDRQIMKNVLAQFLEIGASGGSGTRSTSEDHSRLFELAVQSVARRIVQVLQNTVVRTLVDLNFTDREYPTLRVGNISDDNIPVMSDAIKKFVDAGVLHPRAADENSTRKMIGWSELTDEEVEELESNPEPQKTAKDKAEADDIKAAQKLHASLTGRLYGNTSRAA
jgi:phage gp29-like protein